MLPDVTLCDAGLILPFAPALVETVKVEAGAAGVTLFDTSDEALAPALLNAFTVKVYAMPLVRPVIVIGLEVPIAVSPPGLEITV